MSDLPSPIANEITNKNNPAVIIGPKIVCPITLKNLKTSFLYSVQTPIQFTNPNLFTPILYFFSNSTIANDIY